MSYIHIEDACCIHCGHGPLFRHVTFSFVAGEKIALVGDNGTGKSTLLRMAAGLAAPFSGKIIAPERPYYVPQHFGQYDGMTIAGALGIDSKLQALEAVLAGELSEENYAVIGDDWDIAQRALCALSAWGLSGFSLSRPVSALSGGEKTKVFLGGIALHSPSLILMDEPSNHLDAGSRKLLYALIRNSPCGILVVSHDRTLLNLVGRIYELTAEGVTAYGGNYAFYRAQKEGTKIALEERAREQEKALRAARRMAREAMERKQRQAARGGSKLRREGVPRIMIDTIRNGAEQNASRLKGIHAEKIGDISAGLKDTREKLQQRSDLKIALDDSGLHRGKVLVEAEALNFNYGAHSLWRQPLSFRICSGERIAVRGANGSGKSTLLRLILGDLEPTQGRLSRAAFRSLYVDQEYALPDDRLTVLRQVERCNRRNLPDHRLKTELHRFLFPREAWDKPCGVLSGGEKMKLIFCCLLIGDDMPDLFVLDEPANNLDIRSLEIVASSLRQYRGTLLVISHDDYFLHEIGVGRDIVLE